MSLRILYGLIFVFWILKTESRVLLMFFVKTENFYIKQTILNGKAISYLMSTGSDNEILYRKNGFVFGERITFMEGTMDFHPAEFNWNPKIFIEEK